MNFFSLIAVVLSPLLWLFWMTVFSYSFFAFIFWIIGLIFFDIKYLKNLGFLKRRVYLSTALLAMFFRLIATIYEPTVFGNSESFWMIPAQLLLSTLAGWLVIFLLLFFSKGANNEKSLTVENMLASAKYIGITFAIQMVTIGLTMLTSLSCVRGGGC